MKNKHKNIASMMAPPPTKEATKFEKKADLEIGEFERVDKEREERLERLRRRKMEWSAEDGRQVQGGHDHWGGGRDGGGGGGGHGDP